SFATRRALLLSGETSTPRQDPSAERAWSSSFLIRASSVAASALSTALAATEACRSAGSDFAFLRASRSLMAAIFACRSAICWSIVRRWRRRVGSCCFFLAMDSSGDGDREGAEIEPGQAERVKLRTLVKGLIPESQERLASAPLFMDTAFGGVTFMKAELSTRSTR